MTSKNPFRPIHTSSIFFAKRDYYEILGLKNDATTNDIKKAYYELAKKYHPDVNKDPGASARFQEVSEAYEILSDETKRAQYDHYGSSSFFNQGAGNKTANGWHYQSATDPEELFRKIFGDRNPFADFASSFGKEFAETDYGFEASQQHVMNLTFEEAARGVTKTISANVVEDCMMCHGSGVQPGYKKVSCPYCNGTGFVTQRMGGFYMQTTCSRCRGSGSFNKNPCLTCEGHGRSVQRRSMQFTVPAGVSDGETVRANLGNNTIYITFKVASSKRFKRDKFDIHCDVEISLAQAVLGGTVQVPGIEEDTYIQIPPGTSSHTKLRLTGKGIKRLNQTGRGDQYINIKIIVPKNLNDKQKALMQAWAEFEDTPGTVNGIKYSVEGAEFAKSPKRAEFVSDEKFMKERDRNRGEEEKEGLFNRIKKAIFG
ncbi:unnamed protein product [Dracunculus medinensis]|uniref:J domain-containing protein n=1 Tax=Dracunculus medinensis TaxID=318479 RepID=A0A3P7PK65_DRAME|nr:unnamed protein product [Dracunculus medinensis]